MIVARRGSILDGQNVEGEQKVFPLTIRPNQSLLVEELKSKFENIDHCFDSLFEHINNNGNVDPPPKTVVSNPDSQVICKQISNVLEQWTGRRTQNYFELKHIFQLLNAFSEEHYHGNGLNLVLLFCRELGKSLLLAKRHGTLSINLLFLMIFATLGSVLTSKNFFSFLQTISERL